MLLLWIIVTADRAKSIKTDAKVNHEATDKLIKELIAEKERLLRELENAKTGGAGSTRTGFSDEGQLILRVQFAELLTLIVFLPQPDMHQ